MFISYNPSIGGEWHISSDVTEKQSQGKVSVNTTACEEDITTFKNAALLNGIINLGCLTPQ